MVRVTYEWDCESLNSNSDVVDHYHRGTLREVLERRHEVLASGLSADISLIRTSENEALGVIDCQWAEYVDGRLPQEFNRGARVPRRFHREAAKGPALSAAASVKGGTS